MLTKTRRVTDIDRATLGATDDPDWCRDRLIMLKASVSAERAVGAQMDGERPRLPAVGSLIGMRE
jgi:hypothetical protein